MATIVNKTSGLEIVFAGATTYIKHGNVKLLKRVNSINIYDDSDESGNQRGQAYLSIPFDEVTEPVEANIDDLYNTVRGYIDVWGGSSSQPFAFTADNYTQLLTLTGMVSGDVAYVTNAEGTQWLPGTIGGNYYPNGIYVYTTVWTSDRNAISYELHLDDARLDALESHGTVSNFVNVSTKADLPTAIGGVITLVGHYTYFFLKDLDLTGDRLVGGENTTILAPSSENAKITSTGLGVGVALLTSIYTTPIRHITFEDVDTAFDFDGAGQTMALDWTGVNLENVSNIGVMANVSNFIFSKGALIDSQNWIFTGTQGTVSFDNSLLQGDGSVGNIIEVDALAVIARRFRIVYSSIVAFGSTVGINFNASAVVPVEAYILDTAVFTGGGTYITGVDNTSNKTRWVNSRGVTNTAVNGQIYMHDNVTVTPIADSVTYVKVLGTTTESADNEKYSMPVNNRLTNGAAIERKFLIQCNLAFTTGNNKVCEFAFYDSKLGAIRVPSQTKSTSNAGGRAENVSMSCVVSHSLDDYLEIFTRNTTDPTNVTVTDMNFLITEIN